MENDSRTSGVGNNIIFGAAWLYVATLIGMQQSFGVSLVSARWAALALFCLLGTLDLINDRGRMDRGTRSTREVLTVYLFVTFLTVLTAENRAFSGARWLSHAMMLLAFLVYFRRYLTAQRASTLLLYLKIVIGGILLYSLVFPAALNIYDRANQFRGAFGNSNAFGQIAAFGAVLYLHGGLYSTSKRWHRIQIAAAAISIGLLFRSASRSALLQCLAAVAIMTFFDRRRALLAICSAMVVAAILPLAFPEYTAAVRGFIYKHENETPSSNAVLYTRLPSWGSSWDAFKERPVVGWGFAADADVPKDAEVGVSGIGIVNRDGVSDLFRFLEGSGLIGLVAFVLLIYLAIHDMPLAPRFTRRVGPGPPFAAYHELHILFFAECVGFVVLVQVDNTLISAGNLISALAWMCAGASGALSTYCQTELERCNWVYTDSTLEVNNGNSGAAT